MDHTFNTPQQDPTDPGNCGGVIYCLCWTWVADGVLSIIWLSGCILRGIKPLPSNIDIEGAWQPVYESAANDLRFDFLNVILYVVLQLFAKLLSTGRDMWEIK